MPDPRFYEDLGPVTLGELAELSGAALLDSSAASRSVRVAAPLGLADADCVTFFSDRRYADDLAGTRAGACFLKAADAERLPQTCAAVVTDEPQAAWACAALRLHRLRRHAADQPAVHPSAKISDTAVVCHGAVIGPDAIIGDRTEIGPNAVVGPGVVIGQDGHIGANCTVGYAVIGDRVKLMAGVVVGEAGFGVAGSRQGAVDVPQMGRVILGDDVTIGSCACIDRGAWEDTTIGSGTKIDNLVQVGHNVRIGRNCMIAGHVGISGSVTIGDGCAFGGRVGIADHITVGSGVQLAASAGVMHDIPDGSRWAGAPAKPIRTFMREVAWLARMAGKRDGDA